MLDIIKFVLGLDPGIAATMSASLIGIAYIYLRISYKIDTLIEALAIDGVDRKTHKLSGATIERYGLLKKPID